MELEELKDIWLKLEEKVERNWQLNIKQLKNANLDKAKSKINSLTWITAITLSFYLLMTLLFLIFAVNNWESLHIAAAGIVLTVWSLVIATGSIQQLDLIQKVDYAEPIPVLQRKLETLKLIILKYIRLAQWIIPLYMAFVIFAFKVFLNFDIVAHANKNWLIAQLVFSLTLIPFSFWISKKLHPKNINKKWVNTLMKGAGSQIADALAFIDEIEKFEQDLG